MDSQVQEIKERINIVEVVGAYVQLRRAGRTYSGKCPFHKERTPSFHVSAERGTYKCFGCGEGGDVFSFLQKMDGIDFPTALKQLAEKAGVKLESRGFRQKSVQEKGREERLRECCGVASTFFEKELKKRKEVGEYLRTRGVKDETATLWRLGYAPAQWEDLSTHLLAAGFSKEEVVEAGLAVKSEKKQGEIFDRFRGRIMFPIFENGGAVVAFSGRFFEKVRGQKDDTEPAKYINSPETLVFKKSRTLYGLDRARGAIRRADCILLVEGQFDLLMSHQSGLPFAVALSGTALTDEHLQILSRLSHRLVLALDADPAGVRAGLRSAHLAIAAGFDVKVPTFPDGKDPADVARENPELLKAAVRTSVSAVEFFIEALRKTTKDRRAWGKQVEQQVLPLISAARSSIEREQNITLVASRLGVPEHAVRAEVGKHKVQEEYSPDIQPQSGESALAPMDKKAGMLVFGCGKESEWAHKLEELLGRERVEELMQALLPHEEELRFRFDTEVGEHASQEQIAADLLSDIARMAGRERLRMKFS